MQRQAPRAQDEWNTATGEPLPPPSPMMPSPTDDEINEMVRLLGVKRGVYNGNCAGVVSKLVKRRIGDPSSLSQSEVRGIIETLTAEPDLVPLPNTPAPAPAPDGTADEARAYQMRMMHALLDKGNHTKAGGHALMSRVFARKITSAKQLTPEEADQFIKLLDTGELSPGMVSPGPNADGEGIAEFDVLNQMIRDVDSDEAAQAVEKAIADELLRKSITRSDAELLLERLGEHVAQAKAGASA